MMSQRRVLVWLAMLGLCIASNAAAQSPSTLYSWNGTGNVQQWVKKFGANTVVLDNAISGSLRIIETGGAGATVAIGDDGNRVRESSTANGGLDLTGLSFLEYDLSHSGSAPVNVQFYVQATPSSTFLALGPDVSIPAGGIATYQLPLSGLTPAQLVYIRTLGVNIRDHAAQGDLIWSIQEIRSVGTPLLVRNLATHDVGTSDNGLQGAIANFDLGAVIGNNGLQNQTGLSHDAGTGSLSWTDRGDHGVGDPSGAAITWGNGTIYNGNGFNERTHDASNYNYVRFTISATDSNGLGGTLPLQAFFQNGPSFAAQSAGLGAIPIDGQFHVVSFPLASITQREVVDWVGLNLGTHANDLQIRVDRVQYSNVPEPTAATLLGIAGVLGWCGRSRRRAG